GARGRVPREVRQPLQGGGARVHRRGDPARGDAGQDHPLARDAGHEAGPEPAQEARQHPALTADPQPSEPTMFEKVLIANRGELAVRVMRACREMGIKTVAVYSDVDRDALHVRFADEGWHCGPPPARESYLVGERIVEIAKKSGAEAIHPGYGFLAENGDFADLCVREGIAFIGPRGDVIRAMGDKVTSRQTMERAGVPIVPGTT